MNCCFWIILLLACRGNCGFGCGNDRYGNNCCVSGRKNSCGCKEHTHSDCECVHHEHDECGCVNHMDHMHDECDRMHYEHDDCGCNDNHMGYETYGCQENGIPCPPPVPGNYMR